MITDDDLLEKEDMYILDQVKQFVSHPEVVRSAAAKQLLVLIDRAVSLQPLHNTIPRTNNIRPTAKGWGCTDQDNQHDRWRAASTDFAQGFEEAQAP